MDSIPKDIYIVKISGTTIYKNIPACIPNMGKISGKKHTR